MQYRTSHASPSSTAVVAPSTRRPGRVVARGCGSHKALALGEADLGSLLVRGGKSGRRPEVGKEARRRLLARRRRRAQPARPAVEVGLVVAIGVLAIAVLAALALRWAAVGRGHA